MTTITVMIIPMAMVMKMTTQTVMIMVVAMPTIKIMITKKHNDKDENDHDENNHIVQETLDYNEDKECEEGVIILLHSCTWVDTIIFQYGPPSLICLVVEYITELPHHQTLFLPFSHEYCGFILDGAHFYAVLCEYKVAMLWILGFHGQQYQWDVRRHFLCHCLIHIHIWFQFQCNMYRDRRVGQRDSHYIDNRVSRSTACSL